MRQIARVFAPMLVLLASVDRARCTSIVAIWTPENIVIAADSRVTGDRGFGSTCKIVPGQGFFFATAGLLTDRETGFNLHETVLRLFHPEVHGLKATSEWFDQIFLPAYLDIWMKMKARNAPFFGKYVERSPVQYVIAGMENDTPQLFFRSLVIERDGWADSGTTVRIPDAEGRATRKRAAFFLGQSGAIRRYQADHADWWDKGSLVDAARNLVEVESKDQPQTVGGPIDILVIDRHGARWVQKKPGCPDLGR